MMVDVGSEHSVNISPDVPTAEMRIVRVVYLVGRFLVGLGLVGGLVLPLLAPHFRFLQAIGLGRAVLWQSVSLVTLAIIPVFALAIVGFSWLRKHPADGVGWLAVLMSIGMVLFWLYQ